MESSPPDSNPAKSNSDDNSPFNSMSSKRRKLLQKREEIRGRYERLQLLPRIRVEGKLASPRFVEMVSNVVDGIALNDQRLFTEFEVEYFRRLKEIGFGKLHSELLTAIPHPALSDLELLAMTSAPLTRLASIIAEQLREKDPALFPINSFNLNPFGNEIVLGLSSMLVKQCGTHCVYHSRQRLTIPHNGKNYLLAFHQHSIDGFCKRLQPNFEEYPWFDEVHAYFSYLSYFELATLRDGNLAISIFDLCLGKGSWQYDNYVCGLLPHEREACERPGYGEKGTYGFRVGYCPILFFEKSETVPNDIALARTLLPPGFSKTPENALIDQLCSDPSRKARLKRLAKNMEFQSLRHGDAFEAIQWFHQNGIEQVKWFDHVLFDRDYLKIRMGTH